MNPQQIKAQTILSEFKSRHNATFTVNEHQIQLNNPDGLKMGELHFKIHQGVLTSSTILVSETPIDFRKQGVSRALLATLIKEHPELTALKVELSGTNETIFEQGIEEGLGTEEAFRLTPAFKVRAALGFESVEILDARAHLFICHAVF